eukprot:10939986-Alexandrium_andersonii.AAC.1
MVRLNLRRAVPWSVESGSRTPREGVWKGACWQCGTVASFESKPERGRGWPQHRCVTCKQVLRVGRFKCMNCSLMLAQCLCGTVGQRRIHQYFRTG